MVANYVRISRVQPQNPWSLLADNHRPTKLPMSLP